MTQLPWLPTLILQAAGPGRTGVSGAAAAPAPPVSVPAPPGGAPASPDAAAPPACAPPDATGRPTAVGGWASLPTETSSGNVQAPESHSAVKHSALPRELAPSRTWSFYRRRGVEFQRLHNAQLQRPLCCWLVGPLKRGEHACANRVLPLPCLATRTYTNPLADLVG